MVTGAKCRGREEGNSFFGMSGGREEGAGPRRNDKILRRVSLEGGVQSVVCTVRDLSEVTLIFSNRLGLLDRQTLRFTQFVYVTKLGIEAHVRHPRFRVAIPTHIPPHGQR